MSGNKTSAFIPYRSGYADYSSATASPPATDDPLAYVDSLASSALARAGYKPFEAPKIPSVTSPYRAPGTDLPGAGSSGLDWLNKDTLGGLAALGSTLVSAFALPSQIEFAETQADALKQNIQFAKEDQARRNKNISSFNSFKNIA